MKCTHWQWGAYKTFPWPLRIIVLANGFPTTIACLPIMNCDDNASLSPHLGSLVSVKSEYEDNISTNATTSNLPGPGRLLGRLLGFLGRRLEHVFNDFATKLGMGPEAVGQEIRKLRRHHEISILDRHSASYNRLSRREARALEKWCNKLIQYARSGYVNCTLSPRSTWIVIMIFEDQETALNSLPLWRKWWYFPLRIQ